MNDSNWHVNAITDFCDRWLSISGRPLEARSHTSTDPRPWERRLRRPRHRRSLVVGTLERGYRHGTTVDADTVRTTADDAEGTL